MSSSASVLAPSVGVRPWRHFLGTFDAAARLSLHEGAAHEGEGATPRRPHRTLRADEVPSLDASRRPAEPALLLFSTPSVVREKFAALDPDEIPQGGDGSPSASWTRFADELTGFFDRVQAPVARPYSLLLDVRDPDSPPPLLSGGACRLALRAVDGVAEPWAAHVNLGESPVSLVYWSVPLPAMAALLARDGASAPRDHVGLVRAFVERWPGSPLVRVDLAPGEGALVPVPIVAHDFDASGAADLVVTASALPSASRSIQTPSED